jgi:tRNA (adenine57-N1/adenine58-N1)-methyltransferase
VLSIPSNFLPACQNFDTSTSTTNHSTSTMPQSSPFLTPNPVATVNTLALLSLKRDQTIPTTLRAPSPSDPTDHITNTRFGSFPHSTLLNLPWGSQVIASNIGARERKRGKKRKREHGDEENNRDGQDDDEPAFEAAASGFAHLVMPTPESWTMSLPHRTQVVYTPDYSYVLQRIRALPGDRVIEAGAGSGSFTHAAARAVFTGYPDAPGCDAAQLGKVFSFEYHEPRYETLSEELTAHGLDGIVRVTHRDVYEDGFGVADEPGGQRVTAIFLDLPAPWQAIPHLSKRSKDSPLHPDRAVMVCSFSPCIEQATRAANTLRELGWVDVSMAAVNHRRLDVRRERIGLQEEGLRGVTAVPGTVEEALSRLRELEDKTATYHESRRKQAEKLKRFKGANANGAMNVSKDSLNDDGNSNGHAPNEEFASKGLGSRQDRLKTNMEAAKERKLYKEGRLIHRTEPDLKTHTSYLVFGTLPPDWTDEDEKRCEEEQE